MTTETRHSTQMRATRTPVGIQVLVISCFTGFAIPVSIIAMDQFGVLGLALAGFFAWQWTRLVGLSGGPDIAAAVARLRPQFDDTPDEAPKASGNAAFDAYRRELLDRLEREQSNFEGFLARLRDAKDKTEFEGFLSDRDRLARDGRATLTA